MTDNKIAGSSALNSVTGAASAKNQDTKGTKKAEMGQQDFLQLLVTQLQNQDPLNPMNNEEFAVQLAQFSSLEQLIGINDKLGKPQEPSSGSSIASLASFLGHEVVLPDQQLKITAGKGANLMVDVPEGAQSGRIDFKNEQGVVVGSMELAELEPGRHFIKLTGVDVPDGKYSVRAVVVNEQGTFTELKAKGTGTVEGFMVEPEPSLLINGEQVALANVKEVYAGKS